MLEALHFAPIAITAIVRGVVLDRADFRDVSKDDNAAELLAMRRASFHHDRDRPVFARSRS